MLFAQFKGNDKVDICYIGKNFVCARLTKTFGEKKNLHLPLTPTNILILLNINHT